MNCPNCGGALEAVPNRSHLRCPYCQSLHFPEPVGEGIVPLDRDYPFNCPCCERRLSAAVLDGEPVGSCTRCRGLLLASVAFAEIVARRREVNPIRHRRVDRIDPAEFRRVVPCPRCRRGMDVHTYGAGGNAVIDSCASCGLVWLDAGELTALEQFPARAPAPLPVENPHD